MIHSCSKEDASKKPNLPNKRAPNKHASTVVILHNNILQQPSFLDEWIGFGGKRVTISQDGTLTFDSGKSQYKWTLNNKGQMTLINQKKTPPRRWKRAGMATSELMKDSFHIKITPHTLALNFIQKSGFSHTFLNLLSSRRAWFSLHKGTMSFTVTHFSLKNWQDVINHIQQW